MRVVEATYPFKLLLHLFVARRSLEESIHYGVVDHSLREQSVPLLANLIDSCPLIQLESFDFLGAADFRCNLVLHELIRFLVLSQLVTLGES